MVNFCCIFNCHNRSDRETDRTFHRIPNVLKKNEEQRGLSERRRREWVRQVNRKNITFDSAKCWHRVCSDHFVTGQPADMHDVTHPDWIPTLRLGHSKGMTSKPELYERTAKRNMTKAVREQEQTLQCSKSGESSMQESADSITTVECSDHVSNEAHAGIDQGTQTDLTYEYISQLENVVNDQNVEIQNLREKLNGKDFTEEAFRDKDDRVKYYTALPNFIILLATFNLISPGMSTDAKARLSKFQQFLLVLMKLRLNLPIQVLADMFSVSYSTARRIFYNVLDVLYVRLHPLVIWPERENIKRTMPATFIYAFGRKVTVIIDCFEVKLEKASNLQARNQTYSNYKHGNTTKFLVGITPQGVISYISKSWGGRTSDRHITEQSGFLDKMLPGDLILADRGFNIHDSAGLRCAEVKVPAYTRGKKQLSAFEVESTRKLANVRIHVERVIGSLRQKYTILDCVLPLAYMSSCSDQNMTVLDKIAHVCSALVNCCPSVVLTDEPECLPE